MISIHAPHEGERRGQTRTQTKRIHFNPRSPRGGATVAQIGVGTHFVISIHAPHEGERRQAVIKLAKMLTEKFQSTLPTRGSDVKRSLSWPKC